MEPEYVQNQVDIYQEFTMAVLHQNILYNGVPTTTTSGGSISITTPFITYPNTTTTTGTWLTTNPPFVQIPPDPGPSNEEVDEAIRSIRRTIEKHHGE